MLVRSAITSPYDFCATPLDIMQFEISAPYCNTQLPRAVPPSMCSTVRLSLRTVVGSVTLDTVVVNFDRTSEPAVEGFVYNPPAEEF